METIRCFIAFDLDNEVVLENLIKAQEAIASTGADLKLVKPENIHVTMKFLGETRVSLMERIHEEMQKVVFTPFNVEIKGLGVFPNLRHIRVVWAGIRGGAEELKDIFNQLDSNLRMLGFKHDRKGFSPHITIARVRTGRNRAQLVRRIEELADYDFGVIRAKCLKLKKSVLTPKGPVYSVLKEICR